MYAKLVRIVLTRLLALHIVLHRLASAICRALVSCSRHRLGAYRLTFVILIVSILLIVFTLYQSVPNELISNYTSFEAQKGPSIMYEERVLQHRSRVRYRIPVLAVGPQYATLVLFVEQRLNSISDYTPKNIAYKYSTDRGRTWLAVSLYIYLQ